MNSSEKIFFIIPTYGDFDKLEVICKSILEQGFDCILVDDGSPVVPDMLKNLKEVYYLRHSENLGQGASLQTGQEYALIRGASILVNFDADGQHQLKDALGMINLLRAKNLDVVLGSRFLKKIPSSNIPLFRSRMLKTARIINNFITGMKLSDAHNGLRVLDRKTAELIRIRQNRMAHATEIIAQIRKNKLKFAEYHTDIIYIKHFQKSKNIFYILRILWDLSYLNIYEAGFLFEVVLFLVLEIWILISHRHNFLGLWVFLPMLIFILAFYVRNQKTALFQKTSTIRKEAVSKAKKL